MTELHAKAETAASSMVTIFGDGHELDRALAAVFDSYGSSTHVVTTNTGWLATSDLVVARLDTPAGALALRDLAQQDVPSSRIVCTCQDPGSDSTVEKLAAACSECGEQHHVTLLWHPPVVASLVEGEVEVEVEDAGHAGNEIRATELAEMVAREIREISVFVGPQFDQHSVTADGKTTF